MTDVILPQARLVSLGSVPAQTQASPPTDGFAAHISSFSFGNPGPSAWSVVLHKRHAPSAPIKRRIIFGSVDHATDNAMKLKAATMALAGLPLQARGTVWSDSEYVVKGVNEWLPKWQRSGWRDGKGKPVKNMPEWMTLAALRQQRPDVFFGWVRSYSGSYGDELARTLARSEAEKVHLGQRPVTEITVDLGCLGRLT